MKRKRINRAERRDLLQRLGRATLAIAALLDGATPAELANATECVVDLGDAYHRAMRTLEDAPDEDDDPADRP